MLSKFFSPANIGTDALFRATIQAIVAGLAAIGAVQTNDTGQLNPATATYPAANATMAGYMIFRFNDSLQAVAPIFIKFFFGRGSEAGAFSMGWQIGTSSNGAGTLTGVVGNIIYANSTALPSTDVLNWFPCFVAGSVGAGGTGYMTMCWQAGRTDNLRVFAFSISRTRLVEGTPTGNGCNYCVCANNTPRQRYIDYLLSNHLPSGAEHTHFIATVPPSQQTAYSFQGETPVYPVQPARPFLDFPDLGFILYSPGDIGVGQVFSNEISGEVHKYFALGAIAGTSANPNNTGLNVAVRYE